MPDPDEREQAHTDLPDDLAIDAHCRTGHPLEYHLHGLEPYPDAPTLAVPLDPRRAAAAVAEAGWQA